jgi:hypothetical protein
VHVDDSSYGGQVIGFGFIGETSLTDGDCGNGARLISFGQVFGGIVISGLTHVLQLGQGSFVNAVESKVFQVVHVGDAESFFAVDVSATSGGVNASDGRSEISNGFTGINTVTNGSNVTVPSGWFGSINSVGKSGVTVIAFTDVSAGDFGDSGDIEFTGLISDRGGTDGLELTSIFDNGVSRATSFDDFSDGLTISVDP